MRPGGFTLAEIMVALVLVSLGMLSLLSVIIYSLKAGQFSREHHTMVLLAGNQMAQVQSQLRVDFDASVATSSSRTFAHEPDYSYQVLVNNESPDRKRVDVVVHYEGSPDLRVWIYVYRGQ